MFVRVATLIPPDANPPWEFRDITTTAYWPVRRTRARPRLRDLGRSVLAAITDPDYCPCYERHRRNLGDCVFRLLVQPAISQPT